MARELPIHNGRLTTDLDADGHRIVNLPGGGTDSVSWDNVTGKPTFATVATSGAYSDLTGKPTIPTVPTPVAPSTDPTADGKPADAKATGDALAGKLGTDGGTMTGNINFYSGGLDKGFIGGTGYTDPNTDKTVAWPSEVLQDDKFAMASQIPDVSGKADAADLRYRIAEAGYAHTGAKLPEGVTVWVNGAEDTSPGLYFISSDEWSFSNDGYGAFWDEDGSFLRKDSEVVFKDSEDTVLSTSPNLLVPRALADRTVNLITASDETSIDIELPAAVTVDGVRRARDFFLDVNNSANANDLALEFTALGDEYVFITDEDDDIAQMTTIENGKRVRLYFTECALLPAVPVDYNTFHIARVTLGDFVTSIPTTAQGGN